jgi:hypothetical protein
MRDRAVSRETDFSDSTRFIRYLTAAFKEGYNRDTGIKPPKILTDRENPPPENRKPVD